MFYYSCLQVYFILTLSAYLLLSIFCFLSGHFRTDFFAPDGNDTTEEFSPTQAVVFNSLDFFMTLYQGYLFIFFQIFFLY